MSVTSVSPVGVVLAALPGTLAELSEATGYQPGVVLRMIVAARLDGKRIRADRDVSIHSPAKPGPGSADATTVYVLDAPSSRE